MEDCLYADPTISFRGRKKYTRNLQTLKAFFIDPTIQLYSLEENDAEPLSLKACPCDPSSPHRTYRLLPICRQVLLVSGIMEGRSILSRMSQMCLI